MQLRFAWNIFLRKKKYSFKSFPQYLLILFCPKNWCWLKCRFNIQCCLVKVWSAGSGSPPNKEGTFRPQGRNGGGWLFPDSRNDTPETPAGIKLYLINYHSHRFNHPRSKTCFASFSNVPSLLGGEPEPALQTLTKQHWMLNLHFSQHQFLGQKGLDGTMESFWMNILFS